MRLEGIMGELRIFGSIDQKEYILWKYSILKQWILSEPRFYGKNNSLTIRTISHPELTTLRQIFYEGKKKVIPQNISDLIKNPVTLAIWFMDDGNISIKNDKCCGYHLNTQSFTFEENKLLSQVLLKYYGLICSVQRNNGYYRLYIFTRSANRFREIIEDFIVGSMKYKLG